MKARLLGKKYKYIAFAGPSGGGKSTLCHMLLGLYSNVSISISSTTREKRKTEEESESYYFVSEESFKASIKNDEFIEWAQVHGNYYGTNKKNVAAAIDEGNIVLFDIDVQGVDSLKRIYSEEVLSIFLLPPNMEILQERLEKRGTDSDENIVERMQAAKGEISRSNEFDHQIVNDQLDETLELVRAVLERELGCE